MPLPIMQTVGKFECGADDDDNDSGVERRRRREKMRGIAMDSPSSPMADL